MDVPSPPHGLQAAEVSRVKLLAELDIAERRQPQDGRMTARCPKGRTLPAHVGATREVVELLGEDGTGFACAQCGVNYELHFGPWPQ